MHSRNPLLLLSLPCLALSLLTACGDDTTDDGAADSTDTGTDDEVGTEDTTTESGTDTTTTETDTDTTESETDTDTTESETDTETDTETTESETDTETDTGETGGMELELTGLELLGTYATEVFDESAAEITAHDVGTQRLFVVNGFTATVDVFDFGDPANLSLIDSIDVTAYGAGANSVAVHDGLVAVAVEGSVAQDPGVVAFFSADDLGYINDVQVGAMPDMITFTPDGTKVLTANEGEPDDDYLSDPEGSVAIVDVTGDVAALTDGDVVIADFNAFSLANIDPAIRIFGPGSSVAQDLEPEYVAVSADSTTAYVAVQENNALAVVDIAQGSVTALVALGFKNHSQPGKGLDPSDDDGAIAIANWPVFGMYQPDAIATFEVDGQTYVFSANEGDGRGYDALDEEVRVKDLTLDPVVFPDADALQQDEQLGRLTVSELMGDPDNDGEHEQLYAFGGRSVSVWSASGNLVWDSGDELEQTTAAALPDYFNSNNDDNDSFESRSDNKGPEPEGTTIATLWGKPYAFVGLERVGGVVVYDLSDPQAPALVVYDNSTREWDGDAEASEGGDLGPEGLEVVLADDSPTGEPLLVVANEVSGTISVYTILAE
ncbi:hypothetical protein PPSIR1_19289 [Plesiocystis pacifica SIR-1]|uniref:Choice-of-anchor I domain-containing protein n=1 Tax=Plesiocystis pacifica SIR-1 TaxID=391625 RepID=A6G823_9BACT|nr:choice-of-anchor I family protein [Plesiocystis pacifica]EDM77985.1 hypothetical protein PPSIR1_19289 [Plesiocystis pacifica SIR-1]